MPGASVAVAVGAVRVRAVGVTLTMRTGVLLSRPPEGPGERQQQRKSDQRNDAEHVGGHRELVVDLFGREQGNRRRHDEQTTAPLSTRFVHRAVDEPAFPQGALWMTMCVLFSLGKCDGCGCASTFSRLEMALPPHPQIACRGTGAGVGSTDNGTSTLRATTQTRRDRLPESKSAPVQPGRRHSRVANPPPLRRLVGPTHAVFLRLKRGHEGL